MTHPEATGRPVGAPSPATAAEPAAGTAAAPPAAAAEPESTVGAATATAAATAAPVGRVIAVAAVPPAPGGPPVREPTGDPDAAAPRWRAQRHRRLRRLRVGRHTGDSEALDRLQLTGSAFGLLLGWDQAGAPVAASLFRPEPTRVTLVGGAWAAELLTFRGLGYGARVVVFTADQGGGWIELGRRATGRTDRVSVLRPGSPVRVTASADAPVLRLEGADPATVDELPAWSTRLSVLPQVTAAGAELLRRADVVLTQRLSPAEAGALSPMLGLPERVAHTLQVLQDDMLAVRTPAGVRYAWVNVSAAERDLLGKPRR